MIRRYEIKGPTATCSQELFHRAACQVNPINHAVKGCVVCFCVHDNRNCLIDNKGELDLRIGIDTHYIGDGQDGMIYSCQTGSVLRADIMEPPPHIELVYMYFHTPAYCLDGDG